VTTIAIIACNCLGFKEPGSTHWACHCLSHYHFPFFLVFYCDR